MKINKKIVQHIANLSKLELSEKEKEIYINELEEVVIFMEKLNEINQIKTMPLIYLQNLQNIFREDIVKKSLSTKDALCNASETIDSYFKITKIL